MWALFERDLLERTVLSRPQYVGASRGLRVRVIALELSSVRYGSGGGCRRWGCGGLWYKKYHSACGERGCCGGRGGRGWWCEPAGDDRRHRCRKHRSWGYVCVRACVRACMRACVRACVYIAFCCVPPSLRLHVTVFICACNRTFTFLFLADASDYTPAGEMPPAGDPTAASDVPGSTGRWSKEEQAMFIQGLQAYGTDWRRIAEVVCAAAAAAARRGGGGGGEGGSRARV